MNTLKPLLVAAVLAGIGYGVYVRINNAHDAPPPTVAAGWDVGPKVQMPEGATQVSPGNWSKGASVGLGVGGARSVAPAATPGYSNEAPPYNPSVPVGPDPRSQGGAAAAPYNDSTAVAPPVASQPLPTDPRTNPYVNQPPGDYNGPPQPPVDASAPQGNDAAGVGAYRAGAEGAAPGADAGAPNGFAAAVQSARRELEAGQMASALRQLSTWYDDPQLTLPERQQLHQLLDQVAGTVVYSTQHLLESPYEAQPGERLEDIAQRYSVPWQLLAKINGIEDPQTLRAGERLKVMRGPFSAVISLDKRQLTLLLADGSYAGRFAIGVGREHPLAEGVYAVSDKVVNPVYHGPQRAIGAGDPSNPLGQRWIGLGSEVGIHGTDRAENIGRTDLPGSISLNPRDVEDVYDILSVGSKVTVRR